MPMTDTPTEKVMGRVSTVKIGYDSTHGTSITKGILSFEYDRVHDATSQFVANTKTSTTVFQPHSHFTWKLKFLSDCRVAFFATDVQVAGGNQYALVDNGDSNEIEYFIVTVPIVSSAGVSLTRTYTITNGYCTKNRAYIGNDEDAHYEYEGIAEYISYADA